MTDSNPTYKDTYPSPSHVKEQKCFPSVINGMVNFQDTIQHPKLPSLLALSIKNQRGFSTMLDPEFFQDRVINNF